MYNRLTFRFNLANLMVLTFLSIPTIISAKGSQIEHTTNKTFDIFNGKFCPVYFLNTSKILFETEDWFLSFSIDAKSIRDGLNKTLLR